MARRPDPALRQWWRELISLQPDSGLTIAQFCDQHGISTASFYLWRRKLDATNGPTTEGPPVDGFLSVEVIDANTCGNPFRVHLAHGAVVEIPTDQRDVLLSVVRQLSLAGEDTQRNEPDS